MILISPSARNADTTNPKLTNQMKAAESHINNNGTTYYSTTDENGHTVYSFSQDFEDIWTQEDQDAIDSGSTPAKF